MKINLATRALAALAAGWALGDCVLFATSLLLWTAHLQTSPAIAEADRTRAWLHVIGQGLALIALGVALAAHTLAVFLGLWTDQNSSPWVSSALVLLFGVLGVRAGVPRSVHACLVALALLAALSPPLAGIGWAPCAFAALTTLLAFAQAGYRLGPLSRELAAPWSSR